MWKRVLWILGIFLIGISGGIFADQILWPYFVERPLFYKYRLTQNPIYITERKQVYIQENVALKEAIEKVEKAVIGIRTKQNKKILEGSGLILTSDGLAVSLNEFFPKDSITSVFVEGEITPFEILKRDSKENLILLKVDKRNLKTVGFFELEKLKLGERVFLVGKILEKGKIKTLVNEGIIQSFDENSIETTIFEKNNLAGSPLFDIEGNLVGINKIEGGKVITIPNSKIRFFSGL